MSKNIFYTFSNLNQKEYYLNNDYDENMFESGYLNPNYNSFKKTGTLSKIFEDHGNEFYRLHKGGINRNKTNAPIESAVKFKQEE